MTFDEFKKGCPARFRNRYCLDRNSVVECEEKECALWYVYKMVMKGKRLPAPVRHERVRRGGGED
jgi:hypothetical protein